MVGAAPHAPHAPHAPQESGVAFFN